MNDIAFSRRFVCPTLLALAAALSLAACTPSNEKAMAAGAQAQALLDAGNPLAARAAIAKAIADRDDIGALYVTQARIELALGNRSAAYQAYSSAMALDATNAEALLGVAQFGLGSGHLREAESAADKLLSLDPQQTDAMLVKGIGALVRNDKTTAGSFADQILAIRPEDLGGLILKARALALSGDRAAALDLLQKNVAKTGYTPEMTMSLIELYRGSGDLKAYLGVLQRMREMQPENTPYRLDLVDALYRDGQRDAARAEVGALLDDKFKDPGLIGALIRTWQADDPEAFDEAGLAAASENASIEARLAIARYFIATGRPPLAVTILRPVATGWSSEVQALMARAAGAAGDTAGAEAAADQILAKDSGNGDALLIRSARAIRTGNAAAAVTDAQQVVANYPQWDEGYLALARAYQASDKAPGVRRAFEDALKARPQSAPITTAYVAWLEKTGDADRAMEVARRFALNSPSMPLAWQYYGTVCARHGGGICRGEAAGGLAHARGAFGIDPAPGAPTPIGLVGRLS